MLSQREGEARVRSIQKRFLSWIESHPVLQTLPPEEFNDIRRRVFRSTFFAFRLGVVGLGDEIPDGLFQQFFGWMTQHVALRGLLPSVTMQIAERCLAVTLEAFWVGAQVNDAL